MDRVFYTRRIGGPSDRDRRPSNIQYALKAIGSTDTLNYGFFTAREEGETGRSYYAGRLLFPRDNWSVGLLTTYTERPFLDRTALVNCFEYTLSLGDAASIKGILLGSSIETPGDTHNGFGTWNTISFATKDFRWSYNMTVIHFDNKLDINDMGYSQRNNFDLIMMRPSYNQLNFSQDSDIASINWSSNMVITEKHGGISFPLYNEFRPHG